MAVAGSGVPSVLARWKNGQLEFLSYQQNAASSAVIQDLSEAVQKLHAGSSVRIDCRWSFTGPLREKLTNYDRIKV